MLTFVFQVQNICRLYVQCFVPGGGPGPGTGGRNIPYGLALAYASPQRLATRRNLSQYRVRTFSMPISNNQSMMMLFLVVPAAFYSTSRESVRKRREELGTGNKREALLTPP